MKKVISSLVVVAMLIVSAGCATNMQTGALAGGGIGAGLGALVCRNKLLCAAIGGFAGTMIGVAIGSYKDKQIADRRAAMAAYENKPASDGNVYVSGGNIRKDVLEVEAGTVNPTPVKPGGEASAIVQYSVISQRPEGQVDVTETRYFTVDGDRVDIGKPRNIKVDQGTRQSGYKFQVPDGLEPGTYQLTTEVTGLGQTKKVSAPFQVKG